MILHYPESIDLSKYGIRIPVAVDRAEAVLGDVLADPTIGGDSASWLLGPDGTEIGREDVLRVHAPAYVERAFGASVEELLLEVFELVNEDGSYHRYDPASARRPLAELFTEWLRWMSGTHQAARVALEHGFCFYLGGGTHHGHYDFGHGFCIFNDIVVSLRKLQAQGRIERAWVVDIDAHKGDGTAALTADDPTVSTLSVHMANAWPLDLPDRLPDGTTAPWRVPSTIDVPVAPGEEEEYLPRLRAALEQLASTDADRPDVAYVVDGADPYELDELPSTQDLRLSLEQLGERDRMVYRFLEERGIPQAWLMSGGYGARAWEPFSQFLKWVLRERRRSAPQRST
ncbi:MAG: histone deacetylase [Spirochaetota bacterium]